MRHEGYCSLVHVCVCVSVKSNLTYGVSVHPENSVTYSAGNESQKFCWNLSQMTAFKSYAVKHEQKPNMLILLFRPTHGQLSPIHSKAPEGT